MSKINVDKCEKTLDDLQDVLNKSKLNLHELVWTFGQLGYNIGASLEGDAPNIDEVTKRYYEDPRLGVALMAQGLHIQTWVNDIKESDNDNKTN
jgi:hypothetical protein